MKLSNIVFYLDISHFIHFGLVQFCHTKYRGEYVLLFRNSKCHSEVIFPDDCMAKPVIDQSVKNIQNNVFPPFWTISMKYTSSSRHDFSYTKYGQMSHFVTFLVIKDACIHEVQFALLSIDNMKL